MNTSLMDNITMGTVPDYTWSTDRYSVSFGARAAVDQIANATGGVKHDGGKPPMSLLSREALEQTAAVLEFGKNKYAAHNWRKGFDWSRPLSAAMRHLMAFNDGEDKDPESGLSHLAHCLCDVMFVLEFEKTHPELDDRWKPS